MKTTKFGYDLAYGDLLTAVFIDRALERALRFGASEKWTTELVTLDHLMRLLEGEVVIEARTQDYERLVLDLQHAVVSIRIERRQGVAPSVLVAVQAGSQKASKLEIARLRELLPSSLYEITRRSFPRRGSGRC